jgi:hypothetical protein
VLNVRALRGCSRPDLVETFLGLDSRDRCLDLLGRYQTIAR